MNREDYVVRQKYYRQVVEYPEVKRRRKRLKKYAELKPKVLAAMQATGWTNEQLAGWISAPLPELRNRTPKQCFNPVSINTLWKYVKKHLTSTSTI
jgi:hypothetical protein